MITTNDIRDKFLDYFKHNNHTILPASSLVPHNDPSLMFVNSGMVQFKNYFIGLEEAPYPRVSTSQKCMRAGGKHNDLDNVGYTARHHTFFEMLGNFSFGDYFKEEAIYFSWHFLTKELELPKEKLYITVYHEDEEAISYWKKIASLSDERIIKIATSDNFWSMGDTGPCGPCTEIFYDHGPHISGGLPGTKDADGDRYVEIWNIVFMQFEQLANGNRINLPKQNIDTGMGLERVTAVMQNVHNNYDIDLFKNLIQAIEHYSQAKYNPATGASHRIIADHLRASAFLIADGILPSNEGRGYVLRRVMRRAMRHIHLLKAAEPLMYKLVSNLIQLMGKAYPELVRAEKLITETLKYEEERFRELLARGLKLLEQEIRPGQVLSGEIAFKLYDTFGFPLDLTTDIAHSHNMTIDEQGFADSMARQRELARAHWVGSGEKSTNELWFNLREKYGATEFLGYEKNKLQAEIKAIIVDGKEIEHVTAPSNVQIIANQTVFYGESGGQLGDKGTIKTAKAHIDIIDTKKYLGDLHVHIGKLTAGTLQKGEEIELKIDQERRINLRANHSATHILHYVLRRQLGEHVIQKGSLVDVDKLRFDFSYNQALSSKQLIEIEQEVNEIIRANYPVTTKLMEIEEAISHGAMALFGEKYDQEVRVVSIGENRSIELCGGTHVRASGDIGVLKIISESAVAAGIRRIEAITGKEVINYIQNQEKLIADIATSLKTPKSDLLAKIDNLTESYKKLEKSFYNLKCQRALEQIQVETIGDIKLAAAEVKDIEARDLRDLSNKIAAKADIVLLLSNSSGKVACSLMSQSDKYNAAEIIKPIVEIIGGSGAGGRAQFAQGGGNLPNKIPAAISYIKNMLKN